MSKIEVDSITQQSGTTLTVGGGSGKTLVADAATVTLGRCGGTVALASGASQTGFGRTGTVDWQTTIKTGDFTAVSGEGYFVDTTSGEIDVTLPSSPSAGDIVAVSDYAKNFDTNNCIMLRNGSNIQGSANNLTLSAEGLAMTFVYADSTKGWIVVGAGRVGDKTTGEFIEATGGTITEDGDCKVHTFTGPGTFTVSAVGNASGSNSVNYLVVAGGGGGGQRGGGGGGAGGHRSNFPVGGASGLPVSVQGYPITVGGGGAGAAGTPGGNKGGTGVASVFSSISSAGGGGGGRWPGPPNPGDTGDPGGSGGGGGSGFGGAVGGAGGTGNAPPVSPPQGNNGGSAAGVSSPGGTGAGAGGGGIGAVGGNTPGVGIGGAGGAGSANSITGSPVTRAGGGGGGAETTAGAAGPGGGGAGTTGTANGNAGTTNTGGGGGGARNSTDGGTILGGNGGSGIVIIRYKYQ